MKESKLTHFIAPPRWGEDHLTHFQSVAIQNEFATFAHVSEWHGLMNAIADDLSKCCDYASENITKTEDPSAFLLFMTANSNFLASARLVASGLCLPAFSTARATMESALYGWYLEVTPGAAQRWHDKPTDREERNKWGREFKFSALNFELAKIFEGPAKWSKHLHQTSIDFGAHPNRDALYSNLANHLQEDGSSVLRWSVLHSWDTLAIMTTKFVIETGMFAVSLFGRAYPAADEAYHILTSAEGYAQTLKGLVDGTTLFGESG
ncbi:hypothetical protein [Pseudomonas fluorescens]|uniref:hypothetical protein n=1 Tax=Pseudomonas fluorescens TaxID=294 RepID=UPI001655E017|nr:hypothetical protein [Pseudomonas fluorescens]MBC8786911.1 hypothetical protein [Pseudomonas fluorescens]